VIVCPYCTAELTAEHACRGEPSYGFTFRPAVTLASSGLAVQTDLGDFFSTAAALPRGCFMRKGRWIFWPRLRGPALSGLMSDGSYHAAARRNGTSGT